VRSEFCFQEVRLENMTRESDKFIELRQPCDATLRPDVRVWSQHSVIGNLQNATNYWRGNYASIFPSQNNLEKKDSTTLIAGWKTKKCGRNLPCAPEGERQSLITKK
jgi:hypothetical protein